MYEKFNLTHQHDFRCELSMSQIYDIFQRNVDRNVHIDAIKNILPGNSHDETEFVSYYIFGTTTLWNITIPVESSTFSETNVHCFGRRSPFVPKYGIDTIFLTYQEKHFIIDHIAYKTLRIYAAKSEDIDELMQLLVQRDT